MLLILSLKLQPPLCGSQTCYKPLWGDAFIFPLMWHLLLRDKKPLHITETPLYWCDNKGHFWIMFFFSMAVWVQKIYIGIPSVCEWRNSGNVAVNTDSWCQTCINQRVDTEKAIVRVSRLQTSHCFVGNFIFCKSISVRNWNSTFAAECSLY